MSARDRCAGAFHRKTLIPLSYARGPRDEETHPSPPTIAFPDIRIGPKAGGAQGCHPSLAGAAERLILQGGAVDTHTHARACAWAYVRHVATFRYSQYSTPPFFRAPRLTCSPSLFHRLRLTFHRSRLIFPFAQFLTVYTN
jgi:hypothetical protein